MEVDVLQPQRAWQPAGLRGAGVEMLMPEAG